MNFFKENENIVFTKKSKPQILRKNSDKWNREENQNIAKKWLKLRLKLYKIKKQIVCVKLIE